VAEQLVTIKTKRGFQRLEWQKLRERNEALDCRVYARAAAWIAGADRWTEAMWRNLEQQVGIPEDLQEKQRSSLIRNHRWRSSTKAGATEPARVSVKLHELMTHVASAVTYLKSEQNFLSVCAAICREVPITDIRHAFIR